MDIHGEKILFALLVSCDGLRPMMLRGPGSVVGYLPSICFIMTRPKIRVDGEPFKSVNNIITDISLKIEQLFRAGLTN